MLHSPVSDNKTIDRQDRTHAEPESASQQRALGWAGYPALGLGSEKQSQPGKQRAQGWQPMNLSSLSQGGILQRKCACGNSAGSAGTCSECQSKEGVMLQTKLKIGEPGDKYEQEADRVASQVMAMSDPAAQPIQRSDEENESIQKKPLATIITPLVQRTATIRTEKPSQATHSLESRLNSSQGSPLPDDVRSFMEPRFGADFSQVRVHTDNEAVKMSRELNAQAFTRGQDIFFGAGRNPGNDGLTAHELTHVVQQTGSIQPKSVGVDIEHKIESVQQRRNDGNSQNFWLQRAVSKVCNPPSVWFLLGGPQNLQAATVFGAIAELFISADIALRNRVAPGNFYLDNPLAGPIDPDLVIFIIAKNPGMSLVNKLALPVAAVARPDVLMHQGIITEFEEVKPNSIAGRGKGRTKVGILSRFYHGLSLPYIAGTSYIPHPPFVITSGMIPGINTPITVTFETSRDRNGLLVYDICIETDWPVVSLAAIGIAIVIILLIISQGAIKPGRVPAPIPVSV